MNRIDWGQRSMAACTRQTGLCRPKMRALVSMFLHWRRPVYGCTVVGPGFFPEGDTVMVKLKRLGEDAVLKDEKIWCSGGIAMHHEV